MTEEEVTNTSFLKWVVIILGILILGMCVAIGITVYKRATTTDEPAVVEPTPTLGRSLIQPVLTEFGTVKLSPPSGMTAQSVSISNERLLITYGEDGGTPKTVVVLDPQSGKILGRIELQP